MPINTLKNDILSSMTNVILAVLTVFCFGRTLSLSIGDHSFLGFNIVQAYGIIFSYFFLIFILLNIRKIKIDFTTIAIFLFIAFSFLSFLWGTNQVKEFSKIVLPFTTFLLIRTIEFDEKRFKILLYSFLLGYYIPVTGSFFLILKGATIANIDYYSGVERATGMWSKIHPFAHSMLFFSFLYGTSISNFKTSNKVLRWTLCLVFILSVYCLLRSYTRTTYIGLLMFWSIFLYKHNKKYLAFLLVGILLVGIFYHDRIETIFWKKDDFSINQASSGRISVWKHNLDVFAQTSIAKKFIGHGIGSETEASFGANKEKIISSHNDYVSLLMTLGIVGVFLYSLIYLSIIVNIYRAKIPDENKIVYASMVLVVTIMSFLSNGYLYRLDVSQSFWLIIGIYYQQKEYIIKQQINT